MEPKGKTSSVPSLLLSLIWVLDLFSYENGVGGVGGQGMPYTYLFEYSGIALFCDNARTGETQPCAKFLCWKEEKLSYN